MRNNFSTKFSLPGNAPLANLSGSLTSRSIAPELTCFKASSASIRATVGSTIDWVKVSPCNFSNIPSLAAVTDVPLSLPVISASSPKKSPALSVANYGEFALFYNVEMVRRIALLNNEFIFADLYRLYPRHHLLNIRSRESGQ